MERSGIAVAGSLLVDRIKEISAYPECGELTKIRSISASVGGCVPNVAIDIKKLCPDLEVDALGRVGNDSDGEFIKKTLASERVDISRIHSVQGTTTFTDVMSVSGGQRTFFTYAGADGGFLESDIDFDNLSAKMLHLGYFLLLDKLDAGEGLKILKKASGYGIKTSIDMVSENSDRYLSVVPCLKYTDYLIINETESGRLTGISPTHKSLEKIAGALMEMGVREKVIIHMPDCAVCLSKDGFTVRGAVDVPREYIKGKTGAGDAFCAGALIGIYEGMCDSDILELGGCAAAMALGSADATSGLEEVKKTREFCSKFGRIEVCL